MLEFIVSGQIPGTQIIVTFQMVLAILSSLFGVALARQMTRQSRHLQHARVEDITL